MWEMAGDGGRWRACELVGSEVEVGGMREARSSKAAGSP